MFLPNPFSFIYFFLYNRFHTHFIIALNTGGNLRYICDIARDYIPFHYMLCNKPQQGVVITILISYDLI